VASVSCIYGIGEKEDYEAMGKKFYAGQEIKPNEIMRRLVGIQYGRDDKGFLRGSFRIKGENIDIHLATGEGVVRLKMFGDEIERIYYFSLDPHSAGEAWMADLRSGDGMAMNEITILPAKHFMTSKEKIKRGIENIKSELKERTKELEAEGKSLEADRLRKKTNYDLEMIEEVGYCNGIENYSRHLSGRKPGQPPATLLDFFPDDYLMFIDESHVTIPQIGGMYAGDQSRKQTLVDFGFRLPSAKDNRPLDFQEFNERLNQVIYVSATPSVYEKKRSKQIVEQLIRPTGLLDPKVEVRPTEGQIADLIEEVKEQANKGERVLVTTLTKRMSEELTDFLSNQGIKVRYLHSEIDTLQRVDILRELRKGEFDCLVGINLLREGLDLPEVSLVVILDADMAGFLRNETSLMQTMGRAARHPRGRVVMYADKYSDAMRYAINETNRRRKIQEEYNKKHGIIPKGTKARLHDDMGG
jgi:excinuclease ABC subunit B